MAAAVACTALCSTQQNAADTLQRARELLEAGRPAEAVGLYHELARAYPGRPDYRLDAAVAEYKAGRFRDAVADSTAALKLDRNLYTAWLFLGASHLELGEPEKALEPLRTAVAGFPRDRNARLMLADALLGVARFAEAAAAYERAAELMPSSPRVWYGLGKARDGAAREIYARILNESPDSAYARAAAGDLEVERGQLPQAFAYYRQALARDPSLAWLHAAIADVYEKTDHRDWAAAERRKAAGAPEGELGEARRWAGLAREAFARLGDLPPSAEQCERAADIEERRGQFRAAAVELAEALKLSPASRHVRRRLALARMNSNDDAGAAPLLDELLRAQPDSAELNFLYGSALLNLRDPARAVPVLEKAVRLDSENVRAHGALGQAYLETGRAREAIAHLERGVGAPEESATRQYQLARAYQQAGMPDKAAAAMREYATLQARAGQERDEEPAITPP